MSSLAFRFWVTESEASVVEALKQQDNISKSVVDGEDDLMVVSELSLPESTDVYTIVGIIP